MNMRLLTLAILCAGSALAVAADDPAAFFTLKVKPLLKEKCLGCHGDDPRKIKGELDMRTRSGLLQGGESGKPALIAGNADGSPMILAVMRVDDDKAMPPKSEEALSRAQIEILQKWVTAGAVWPSDADQDKAVADQWKQLETAEGLLVRVSAAQSVEWATRRYPPEDIWAFRPVTRPTPPSPGGNPIDAFIQDRLNKVGLAAAPAADRRTLIRRATVDLLGLLPTADEIEEFDKDPRPDAYARLLDRLLASPHYGEQWGRHWLDISRYADSNGFSNDFERPNAWRYRDYVIRSFNSDKPYDRFVTEQIAGDEVRPDDPEMAIAVGFLRMGPWEHTAMSVPEETRQLYLDDVTNAVGETFLGITMTCFKCHDHKFDPLPTRDYYSMQAVFAPVQFAHREVPFLPTENIRDAQVNRERIAADLKAAQAQKSALNLKEKEATAAFLASHGAKSLKELSLEERGNARRFGLTDQEKSQDKVLVKRIGYREREVTRYAPLAFSVYNGPPRTVNSNDPMHRVPDADARQGTMQAIRILQGGSLAAPGDPVAPGVLSAVTNLAGLTEPKFPDGANGRRAALADWIVDPKNPLTARVIVNRVWHYHFGAGIVATPNAFGKMGARPTHPELLDFLAGWFVDNGWSLKKLHGLIMSSEAYRRSGRHSDPTTAATVDPDGQLLASFPPRRLEAEEIRDSMLNLTGELHTEAGGPPIFPEINWDVALQPRHIMGSLAPAYQPSPLRQERNRRTVYAVRYRTLADPMLEVFNRPGSEFSCGSRDRTTVTTQVFALFNGQAVYDRALAAAARIAATQQGAEPRVRAVFQLLLGRQPAADERLRAVDHVNRMTAYHTDHIPVRTEQATTVTRQMIEELTGAPVEIREELNLLKVFEPDLKPWDVDAGTRALAELCLVLFNTNEFIYVY